jgi:two-component system chemotaxis response regulator CheV
MNMSNKEKRLDLAGVRAEGASEERMEILLFSLGSRETFGINVFKVREVGKTPHITRTPNMPKGVEGLVTLRGTVIPVLSLASFLNLEGEAETRGNTMMVAQFSKRTVGFLVDEVDRIISVDWARVRAPESVVASDKELITAVVELDDRKLLSILDVEQIIANAFGEPTVANVPQARVEDDVCVFFIDDSIVARRLIGEVLDKLGVRHKYATNGAEAWTRLQAIAAQSQQRGRPLSEEIKVILTDAEMPEMDGYALTRNIRSDPRFDGVPVVMHSSLSSETNSAKGRAVGVDRYVGKFDSVELAETLRPILEK